MGTGSFICFQYVHVYINMVVPQSIYYVYVSYDYYVYVYMYIYGNWGIISVPPGTGLFICFQHLHVYINMVVPQSIYYVCV